MTINEAIYQVLDGVNISTDDFPARKRFVYNEIKNARKELIKQELNKNRLLDNGSLQTIECYTFERVDSSTCKDCPTGQFVLKGKSKVPEVIDYNGGQAFFLYLMNGTVVDPINRVDWMARPRKRFKLNNSFGYFISNQYPIIVGYDDVDELCGFIEGHFCDPETASLIDEDDSCSGYNCKPVFELPFICPGLIVRRVFEIAKASIIQKLNIPSDDSNNNKFDTNVQGKT